MRFVGLLQHLQLFVHSISSILEPFMDSKRIRRCCLIDPDVFCYICGEYKAKEHRFNVRDVTKKSYQAHFDMKLGDQDKSWSPHKVSKYCTETLRLWTQGKAKFMEFGVPMVWREPKNHHDDCYFCMVNMSGWNRQKNNSWQYPARRPIPHCSEIQVPDFTSLPDLVLDTAFTEVID